MNKDKEFDDLFKKNLEDQSDHAGYNEGDWEVLEDMLDRHKKRKRIIYWLPLISGAAALLLLFIGLLLFRQQPVRRHTQNNSLSVNHGKRNTGINDGSTRQQPKKLNESQNADDIAGRLNKSIKNTGYKPLLSPSAAGSRRIAGSSGFPHNESFSRSDEILTALAPVADLAPKQNPELPALTSINTVIKPLAGIKNTLQIRVQKQAFRPQFALTVLAAPDINGAGSFQQAKVGTNAGLLFTAGISKKLTLSTGAVYSIKPYLTSLASYQTPSRLLTATADCRMLDIPLDIGYQVYNKRQNKIILGTGLSSYIMLHQSYKFNYAGSYSTGQATYTVPGVNKYYLGVLNLNATYQHQLNPKLGVSLQPYLKLPLTNLGYSQVRLQTTGVAVGFTWNLGQGSKP